MYPVRILAAWLVLVSAAWAAEPGVTLEKQGDHLDIKIDGRLFTTYHFDKSQAKPYFHPVLAADGTSIVRGLEKPEDHPHHKGIWFSIDEVNGIRYWAEKGKIQNQRVEVLSTGKNPAQFVAVNHWLGKQPGEIELIETARVTIHANRLMQFDFSLTAPGKKVTFDDTKEGLFGIRVANTLREKGQGHLVNAEGNRGMKACWGLESKWVDYFGPVQGKTYGVAIFDNPANFRRSRFHCRDYGLFTLSPFGQSAYTNGKLPPHPFILGGTNPHETVRLQYGLYVHNGNEQAGQVADAYQHYLHLSLAK